MEGGGRLPDESEAYENSPGEALDVDMRWPVARSLHRVLKRRRENPNTVMDLGEELGEVHVGNINGARPNEEEGKLTVYIRRAGEHKEEVAVAVIAVGVVIGGLAVLKYKKR